MNSNRIIAKENRIEAIDSLRGFALFGVLIANLVSISGASISSESDSLLLFFTHFFIDRKFISIFSILFGFGFYIQETRAVAKKINFNKYFFIRMSILFIIGGLHSYGIWKGDILMSYAVGGMLLLCCYKRSPKTLLRLSIASSVFLTGILFIGNNALGWSEYSFDLALHEELPITPSYGRYLILNFILNPWTNFIQDIPITISFTFGNILLGLILGKIHFFQGGKKAKTYSNYFILFGSTLGLISSYFFHQFTAGHLELSIKLIWLPFALIIGMLLQSMFYISIYTRIFKYKNWRNLLRIFTYVGRTSLSNYILQSIFYLCIIFHCTQIFQLYGKVSIAQIYVLGICIFLFQTLLSYLWLKKFSHGPLEYIWKKLSYNLANV